MDRSQSPLATAGLASVFRIIPVRTPADLEPIRALFQAYVASLGVDIAYQGFEAELATLPGKYAPPQGELLLARRADGEPLGCVALRPLDVPVCEMKRLYVAPGGRGTGLGRALAEAILEVAERSGYREIWLDTLPTMAAAVRLYERLGFKAIPPYNDSPFADLMFMGKVLGPDPLRRP